MNVRWDQVEHVSLSAIACLDRVSDLIATSRQIVELADQGQLPPDPALEADGTSNPFAGCMADMVEPLAELTWVTKTTWHHASILKTIEVSSNAIFERQGFSAPSATRWSIDIAEKLITAIRGELFTLSGSTDRPEFHPSRDLVLRYYLPIAKLVTRICPLENSTINAAKTTARHEMTIAIEMIDRQEAIKKAKHPAFEVCEATDAMKKHATPPPTAIKSREEQNEEIYFWIDQKRRKLSKNGIKPDWKTVHAEFKKVRETNGWEEQTCDNLRQIHSRRKRP